MINVPSYRDVSRLTKSGASWALEFYDTVVNRSITEFDELVECYDIDINAEFSEARDKADLDLSPIHLVCCHGYAGESLDLVCCHGYAGEGLDLSPVHLVCGHGYAGNGLDQSAIQLLWCHRISSNVIDIYRL